MLSPAQRYTRTQLVKRVDDLDLTYGDPIEYAGQFRRYAKEHSDRRDKRYVSIRRLTPEEVVILEASEREAIRMKEERAASKAVREAFLSRSEVQDAERIRYLIEDNLERVVERLTPEAWAELRLQLEPMEGAQEERDGDLD